MIYFDNAATGGYKPESVYSAAINTMKYMNVNAGRGSYSKAILAEEYLYKTRKAVCEFFNSDKCERVIFTKNCTEALNIAILGSVRQGGHVITTVYEHNSVLRPLYHLKNIGKISLSIVKPKKTILMAEDIASEVKRETCAAVITAASNVSGEMTDYEGIGNYLKDRNITFILDAAQAAGHLHLDMKKQHIDVLCFAGHKGLNALQGVGGLVFCKNIEIAPSYFGGSGTETFSAVPSGYPEKLECGTLNLPAIISLLEGVLYNKYALAEKQRKLLLNTGYLCDRLCKIKGIRLYSKKNPVGIVSFSYKNIPSQDISAILSESFDIAVRGGFHCAPLMHEFLKTDDSGLVRVSLNEQNTQTEIDRLVFAMQEIDKFIDKYQD